MASACAPELNSAFMEATRALAREAAQTKRSFMDWAASLEVVQAEWLVAHGTTVDALAQAAIRHDLLVLDHARNGEGMPGDLPGVILRAGAPCLVLPAHGVDFKGIERVAIGWNSSPEAMRAVHAALPLLQGRETLLLRGEEREQFPGLEWEPPFDIVEYLDRHGVRVEQRNIDARRDDAAGELLEEALEYEADLFVMGAYGRSRFSEWMLGGVTRYVLTWSSLPVLMRH